MQKGLEHLEQAPLDFTSEKKKIIDNAPGPAALTPKATKKLAQHLKGRRNPQKKPETMTREELLDAVLL